MCITTTTTTMVMMKLSVMKIALLAAVLLTFLVATADGLGQCAASSPKYRCPNCGGIEVTDCFDCDGYFSTDTTHNMCIDRKLFNQHDTNTSDFDNHYHYLWNDLLAMLVWFFMGGIATACGVGGGGIYVPLGMLLLQFSPKQASGLSQCSIFGATLGGLILNIQDTHPADKITDAPGVTNDKGRIVQDKSANPGHTNKFYTRPVIDYDMVLFLAPIEMGGAVLGVVIQTFLPNWAFLMVAGIVLLFTAYKTYCKFWDTRMKERKAEQEARDLKRKQEFLDAEAVEDGKDVLDADLIEAPEEESALVPTDDTAAALRKEYLEADMRQYPADKLTGLVVLWLGVLLLTILRGGKGVPSLIGITCESVWYGILIGVQFTWLFGFAGFFAMRLLADQKKRVAVLYPYQDYDVVWNGRSLQIFGFSTFFAGVIAGLIGIGGGMILGPMMLIMEVHPRVSTATTATMIVLTSSSVAIIFVTSGIVPWSYAVFFFFVCFFGALFGKRKIDAYVKRTGRASLLIFILASIILFATFGCIFQMLLRLSEKDWCFDGLNQFCKASKHAECPVNRVLNSFLEGTGFPY